MKVLGFSPRPSQAEIFKAKERFLVLDAGRRFGKSLLGLNWLLSGACAGLRESWWVAPIYSQSKMTFRTLLTAARKGGGEAAFKSVSHSELRIELINGSAIMFKSADNPDNLRGEGLGRVVVDEAARVQRSVWEEVLRPAVSDTGGSVLFASTPKGKNIFYELYTRGQDPLQNQFRSWKFPTSDNPKVLPDDIEHARQSLPLDVFNQEYLAEFLDNSAGVFRNVGACTMPTSTPTQPEPGASYSAGLDLGRLTDFTVLTILDAKGRQVFTDRFNLLDWTIQKRRAVEAVTRYNLASLLVDATGLGDPIYEDLRNLYPNVVGYKFTNESKGRLIEALMMAFEQGEIKIFDDATQRNELDIYEYTMNRSGSVSYNAPDGYHDDTVIALALAWWQFKHNSGDWKIRWA